VLLYFITISLSIVTTIDPLAFFDIYKHIVFGLLFFFVSLMILNNKNRIRWSIYILGLTILVNYFYQLIIYFFQNFLFTFQNFFYYKYWEVLRLNLNKQKFFVDVYDSALIPVIFILFYWFKNNLAYKFYKVLAILTALFFAAVSNFRTQLLMAISSLIGAVYVSSKNKRGFISRLFGLMLILIVLSSIFRSFIESSTIERIVEPSQAETQTITTRFDWWKQSIEMGISSPLVGIGLNNFYEYLSPKTKINNLSPGSQKKLARITAAHPHSIFFQTIAETGVLGFISLMLLLIDFIKNDIYAFKRKNIPCNLIIVSFWSIFLFSIFNPPITLQYLISFWFLRALTIKLTEFSL